MALGVDDMPIGKVVRKRLWLFVGMFLVAGSITAAFLAMRDLMDVGGFCAQGGAYVIRQECPDTTWLLLTAFPVGLVGVGFLIAGYLPTGPSFVMLAWSGLFLAMGVNFLLYGLDPPPPATGFAWGWLVCAVVLLPMGGLPLVNMLRNPRKAFWDDRDPQPHDVAAAEDVVAGGT